MMFLSRSGEIWTFADGLVVGFYEFYDTAELNAKTDANVRTSRYHFMSLGLLLVQRLNARENAAGSEMPSR